LLEILEVLGVFFFFSFLVCSRDCEGGDFGARMSLWQLLEAILMITNALAILNQDRFLTPHGWGFAEMGNGRVTSIKGQIVGLLHAVQYLRVPLVALNSIIIVSKLLL
jgi:hypothetical protein